MSKQEEREAEEESRRQTVQVDACVRACVRAELLFIGHTPASAFLFPLSPAILTLFPRLTNPSYLSCYQFPPHVSPPCCSSLAAHGDTSTHTHPPPALSSTLVDPFIYIYTSLSLTCSMKSG
eukprot:GHVU01226478.1.p1 GENE.GHVU01226478.1~~GHVU01226478.1.p1  ORF type:complete len:122 (+),score=2.49 GHVU01226478.1:238-603(+)